MRETEEQRGAASLAAEAFWTAVPTVKFKNVDTMQEKIDVKSLHNHCNYTDMVNIWSLNYIRWKNIFAAHRNFDDYLSNPN